MRMDILAGLFVILLVSPHIFSKKVENTLKFISDSVSKSESNPLLDITSWLPFELSEKDKPRHPTSETSKHLQNVIEFYNNTSLILDKLEAVLRYEPFNVLNEETLFYISRFENIISKLEEYLQNMKNGRHDGDQQYEAYMVSINHDINELGDQSKNLEKLSIHAKINEDREDVIKLLTTSRDNMKSFEVSIDYLNLCGIELRNPLPGDPFISERFDISILVKLMEMYKTSELNNLIATKRPRSNEKHFSKTDIGMDNKIITPPSVELPKTKLFVKSFVNDNAAKLRQFVPTVNAMKQKVMTLIPETDEAHEKLAQTALTKVLSAFAANKKMMDLINEIKDVRKQFNNAENRDEL